MAARVVLACVALMGVCGAAGSGCSYLSLMDHLNLTSSTYSMSIMRSVRDWRTVTYVLIDMLLYGILEVNEKSQTITNHVWIQMLWEDEFLTWDPSKFCGITVLNIPRSKPWIPDIGIQEDTSDTGSIKDAPFVTVYHNGTMVMGRRQRLTYTCQFNLTMFPFDRQTCFITFTTYSSDADAVRLSSLFNGTTLSAILKRVMITQGEWKINWLKTREYINHKSSANISKLEYQVQFERKPMLYVIYFIVPLFYLLVLDLTSFFISEARGEKMSFKVTILLSISVLLLILPDMLPSTEEKLPWIAAYCVGIFALVGISVLEAMLVTFLIDLDGYCAVQKSAKTQEETPVEVDYYNDLAGREETVQVKPGSNCLSLAPVGDAHLLQLILDELKAARLNSGQNYKEKRKYKHWAEVLDHVFFFLYFFTVVVFLLSAYFKWMRGLN